MQHLKYTSIGLGIFLLLVGCSSSQGPSVNDGLKALLRYESIDFMDMLGQDPLKDDEDNTFFPKYLSSFKYVVPKDSGYQLDGSEASYIPPLLYCDTAVIINQKKYILNDLQYRIKFYAEDFELGDQRVYTTGNVATLLMEVNGVHFRNAKQISFDKKIWTESKSDDQFGNSLAGLDLKGKFPKMDWEELKSQVYTQTLSFEVDTYQISGDPIRCGFQVKTIPAQVTANAAWIKAKDGKWVSL